MSAYRLYYKCGRCKKPHLQRYWTADLAFHRRCGHCVLAMEHENKRLLQENAELRLRLAANGIPTRGRVLAQR